MTNHFNARHVEAAIAGLSTRSSIEIHDLLERARQRDIVELAEACVAELELRPFEFTSADAGRFADMERLVLTADLEEAVVVAFGRVKAPDEFELKFLKWLAANPGGSYAAASIEYGKGDLSLVIGHLVYDRFGCFRKFFQYGEDQSSVLIRKERGTGSVRYWMKPEFQLGLMILRVI